MWLLRSFATIGSMTLLSRIAGLVRDQLMANILGVGMLSDVFNVANRLPNFLRRIFAEGAFNAAFVPMFSSMLAKDGKEPALEFAARVQAVLATALIGLSVLAIICMPWVMWVYAWGFGDEPEKFELVVYLTRITFGYLLFIALTSLLSGLLNSADRYAAAAFVPTLLNLFMIGGLLLADHFETPAHALSWSVLTAGVAQWVWMMVAARRHGLLPRFVRPRLSPDVVKMLTIMAPVALASSIAQVNLMVDTMLASLLETGSISYLYYADRLNQLPLGIIGVGVGTALLPLLSRLYKSDQIAEARTQLNRALEFALLLSLPAAAALIAIAYPIIRVIYQHGAFTAENTEITANILKVFAFGLPSFVLVKILITGFFATQDTKTPLRIGVVCMVLNTALCVALMWEFGAVAMAAATSISGWVNALSMVVVLRKRELMLPDDLFRFRLLRLLAATALMTAILLGLNHFLTPWVLEGGIYALLALAALVSIGLASYGAACFALRLTSIRELKSLLRQRKTPAVTPPPEATQL
jgi:putative peptidoglycan lipid II flippase